MQTEDWIAYSLIGGTAKTLFRGTQLACAAYIRENYVTGKGSLHVAYRPLKRKKRSFSSCTARNRMRQGDIKRSGDTQ